jgi:hypothetical protein
MSLASRTLSELKSNLTYAEIKQNVSQRIRKTRKISTDKTTSDVNITEISGARI